MRTLIVILLSVIFSLNAAFAAVAGVCDAIDHLPQGGSEQHFHVDQHSHSVSETMADERANGDTDTQQGKKSSGGHCHAHSTTATAVTASNLVSSPNLGHHVLIAPPSSPFASFIPAGLDRPPRDSLA
jgi:hypothetical protein